MPHHHHHYLPSTLQHQSSPLDPPAQAEPTPAAASDRPRKRRQRADDLVPAGCGLTRDDIVCLPIDDFNDKVAEKSEKEIVVLKDKRRKGKNRMAARKSREKKMAKIRYLKTEHVRLSRDHDSFLKQRKAAEAESNNWLRRVEKMEGELKRLREIFDMLNRQTTSDGAIK